jgi:DNA polymerase-3 subunit beta
MKVICDREKLREGLALANNVIPAKSTKPVVENVCLVATDNALELVGTDMEVSLRYCIDDVKVEDPGTAVIPARVAFDFVRDLSGETISLEVKGSTCTIESGADTCELVTVDPDEFPVVARFDGENAITMQGGSFAKLVEQTAFAAAREPGRYAMHGVLAELEADTLRMIATDGRRLALSETPVDGSGCEGGAQSIVPTRGMQMFCRAISDPLDQVQLQFGETKMGLKTKNAEVFARLIDGEFPRYAAVIPADTTRRMEADRDLLVKKLRLVANVTGDEARAVKLKMSKNQLEVFGQSAGRGEATAHMEVDYKGDTAEIAFNPDYVIEGLKNCTLDTLSLEFTEHTSPGKFQLGEGYVYVVMPITVDV